MSCHGAVKVTTLTRRYPEKKDMRQNRGAKCRECPGKSCASKAVPLMCQAQLSMEYFSQEAQDLSLLNPGHTPPS